VVRATGGRGAGWLGSTAGLTGDGQFVALARFESEEAARRNSVRPEQDQWWMETSKLFAGEVIFRDSSDVIVDVNGDPGTAGFVPGDGGPRQRPGPSAGTHGAKPRRVGRVPP
jgi:hypothetical protein